jgi:hypothetical protein
MSESGASPSTLARPAKFTDEEVAYLVHLCTIQQVWAIPRGQAETWWEAIASDFHEGTGRVPKANSLRFKFADLEKAYKTDRSCFKNQFASGNSSVTFRSCVSIVVP